VKFRRINAMNKEYNGYTNYETWLVSLWIDNDEGLQRYWIEESEHIESVSSLQDSLQTYFDEHIPPEEELNGVYLDLMNYALSSVNWYEIAEELYNEYHAKNEESEGESDATI